MFRQVNYERKAVAFAEGHYQVIRKAEHDMWLSSIGKNIDTETAEAVFSFYSENKPDILAECFRMMQADYKRTRILKTRIEQMISHGPCVFVTLTFTDDVLSSTSPETRRKYVTRYLASQSAEYIANKDFGAEHGREHYHGVLNASKIDFSAWVYGTINGQRVRNNAADTVKIAKYTAKLTNHAIKETAKRSAIIYSKAYQRA